MAWRRFELRDRVEVRPSGIHGRGVFARRRLRKESYIASFEGEQTDSDGTHVLWLIEDDGSETGILGRNELRFLNHSARPNAEFRGADLHAIRNIQPGEEITCHYGAGWDEVE